MFVNTDLMGPAFGEQRFSSGDGGRGGGGGSVASATSIQNASEADLVCEIYYVLTHFFLMSLEPLRNPKTGARDPGAGGIGVGDGKLKKLRAEIPGRFGIITP